MVGVFKKREDAEHQNQREGYPQSNFGAQTTINGIGEQPFKITLYHIRIPITPNLTKGTRIVCERQILYHHLGENYSALRTTAIWHVMQRCSHALVI